MDASPPNQADAPTTAYRASRARLRHGYVVSGVLGAVGLGILFFGGSAIADASLVGAVAVALAAGVAYFARRAARDTSPRMTVTADGVWFRDWGLPPVPWQRVAGVYTAGSRINTYVCIEVDDWRAFAATLDDAALQRCRSNRLIRGPRLMVPSNAVDAPFDEVLAALREAKARDT